jgi:hypothetical protein
MNIPAPNAESLQMSPKIQNGDAFGNGFNGFDYVLVLYVIGSNGNEYQESSWG